MRIILFFLLISTHAYAFENEFYKFKLPFEDSSIKKLESLTSEFHNKEEMIKILSDKLQYINNKSTSFKDEVLEWF